MENSTEWKMFGPADDSVYACTYCDVELLSHQVQNHVASAQHYQNTITKNTYESQTKVGFEASSIKTEDQQQFQCHLPVSDQSYAKISGQSDQEFVPKCEIPVPQIPTFTQSTQPQPQLSDKILKTALTPPVLPVIDLTSDSDDETDHKNYRPPTSQQFFPVQTKSESHPQFHNQKVHSQTNLNSNQNSRLDSSYFGGTVIENQYKNPPPNPIDPSYQKVTENVQNFIQTPSNFYPHPPAQFQYKTETNSQIQANYSNSNSYAYSNTNSISNSISSQGNFNNPYENTQNKSSPTYSNPQNPSQNPNQITQSNAQTSGMGKQLNQNQYFSGKVQNPNEPQVLNKDKEREKEEARQDIRIKFREERLRRDKEWEEQRVKKVKKLLQKELLRQQQQQQQQPIFPIFPPNSNSNLLVNPLMNPHDISTPAQPWTATLTLTPAPSVPEKKQPVLLTCKFCPETFKIGTDVLRHEIYYHKMKPVDPNKFCKICGKRYSSIYTLRTHMKKIHGAGRKK